MKADMGNHPLVEARDRASYLQITRSVDMTTEIVNQVSLNVT